MILYLYLCILVDIDVILGFWKLKDGILYFSFLILEYIEYVLIGYEIKFLDVVC